MIGIGVMSGSSLDGLDIVAVEFIEGEDLSWKVIAYETYDLDDGITGRLSTITTMTATEIFRLNSDYTLVIAGQLQQFILDKRLQPNFVAVHGHTVMHSPEYKSSWQLLNGGLLASTINCDVVCDFRNNDMAKGGQGTPMAVLADRDLYPGYDYYVNLGGIANISFLKEGVWSAYDLFPFNQVLNHFSRKVGQPYDKNGVIASQGKVDKNLLNQLLTDPYILKAFPKSIDNDWVKTYWMDRINKYNLSSADVMRTYVEFAAMYFSNNITKGSKILWSGGGVHHTFFIKTLESKSVDVNIHDTTLIDSKEAVLIAYAGYLRLCVKPNFVSSATGASDNVIGGAVYKG